MEKVFITILMGLNMMVHGKMIICMEPEFGIILMAHQISLSMIKVASFH